MRKFVISLEKDSLRRELFFKQDNTGDFSVFSAFNALKLSTEELSHFFDVESFYKYYNRDVTSGEIGCTLSHINLYKKVYSDNNIDDDEFILVCEDDVLFSQHFFTILSELSGNTIDADILVLGQSKVNSFCVSALELKAPISLKFLSNRVGNSEFLYGYPSHYYYEGTVCYLIKKSAIAKFLIHNNILPYWLADDFSLFYREFGIKIKMLRPIIAIENPLLESNLEKDRVLVSHKRVIDFEELRYKMKYPLKKIIAIAKNLFR